MADWVFDGGRVSIDLVNTLRDRKTGGTELLTSSAAVGEWFWQAGLATRPDVADVDLAHIRTLREAVDRVLRAPMGSRPPAEDVRLINEAAAAVPPVPPQLRYDRDGKPCLRPRSVADPVRNALAIIAVDAIETAVAAVVLRICAAEDCGLRFADVSPKRNRQWCSMARCGNRAKARKHYARSKDA
ncbi:CGNR zinc finger domain-containing protein [Amycolatopsis minnesotensis]|uniref:CGNR zinc finger domain-containing protein n=1 Tax=Amycolatopsis minnesotensis TaxID=337894 RepID=A0ABN2S5E1_9PSEU